MQLLAIIAVVAIAAAATGHRHTPLIFFSLPVSLACIAKHYHYGRLIIVHLILKCWQFSCVLNGLSWVGRSAGWCEIPLDRFTIQVVHRVNGENWPVDWWSIWKRWNWSGSDGRGDLWVDWQLNRRQACISPQPESAIEPRPLRPPGGSTPSNADPNILLIHQSVSTSISPKQKNHRTNRACQTHSCWDFVWWIRTIEFARQTKAVEICIARSPGNVKWTW